jgi:hypothetical protein
METKDRALVDNSEPRRLSKLAYSVPLLLYCVINILVLWKSLNERNGIHGLYFVSVIVQMLVRRVNLVVATWP